jgi:hypothetical protein
MIYVIFSRMLFSTLSNRDYYIINCKYTFQYNIYNEKMFIINVAVYHIFLVSCLAVNLNYIV